MQPVWRPKGMAAVRLAGVGCWAPVGVSAHGPSPLGGSLRCLASRGWGLVASPTSVDRAAADQCWEWARRGGLN